MNQSVICFWIFEIEWVCSGIHLALSPGWLVITGHHSLIEAGEIKNCIPKLKRLGGDIMRIIVDTTTTTTTWMKMGKCLCGQATKYK